jgi:DNA-binding transcriptional MerR regulator
METPAGKIFFSIKEAAEMAGESESTLRYWESEFQNVISPKRNEGGTRFYSPKDMEDIRLIRFLLREKKLTLEGARKSLKNNKESAEKQAKLLERLRHIHRELKEFAKSFEIRHPSQC